MPKNNRPEITPKTRFNRLVVLGFSHADDRWRKWYYTQCDCGIRKIIMGSAMISGNTKNCGCYSKEVKKVNYYRTILV